MIYTLYSKQDYSGNQESRTVIRNYEIFHRKRESGGSIRKVLIANVLITSYEVFISDASWLKRLEWGSLVVDEGHRLKNAQSKLFTLLSPIEVIKQSVYVYI